MSIMRALWQDLYLWNDIPVLHEGNWRVLVPNNYGRKYRNIDYPVVVHKCPTDIRGRDFVITTAAMRDDPVCDDCKEAIPEDIQGLYKLYEFDRMSNETE